MARRSAKKPQEAMTVYKKRFGLENTAGVKTESGLTTNEYNEVKALMEGAQKGTGGKRKGGTGVPQPPKQLSEEEKLLRARAAARTTALRKLKGMADKMRKEIKDGEDLLPILINKGYPTAMRDFYNNKFDEPKTTLETSLETWSTMAKASIHSIGDVDSDIAAIETAATKLETIWKTTKAEVTRDLKNLTA